MRSLLVAIMLLGLFASNGLRAESYDEQNRAMLYFVMHLSSTNAINGLNLSLDQAVKLRALAVEMEKLAPKPNYRGQFRPDLGEVRDTYVALGKVLEQGLEVPAELEPKVGLARATEAAVIKASLRQPNANERGCAKCHGEPTVPDLRSKPTLVVPTLNDDAAGLKTIAEWIAKNLGTDTPWHLERFTPMYKLRNLPPTPQATLEAARRIGQDAGLKFVYISNLAPHEGNHTYCPHCKKVLITRLGFKVLKNELKNGQCPACQQRLPGLWA